jgi:hypothetical protein
MEMEFNMKMFNSMRLRLLAAGILSASVLVGCGSDSSPNANTPTVTNGSLTAAFGALAGASCAVTNSAGTTLTTVTTGANGVVDLDIETVNSDFPIIVTCSGGTYFDEANPTAAATTNTGVLRSIMPDLASFNAVGNNLAVTTLTDLSVELYNSLTGPNQNTQTALASLAEIIRILAPSLGTNGGGLNLLAAPTPVTAGDTVVPNTPAGIYASYLAGLASVAKDKGITPSALGALVASQIRTGVAIDTDTVNNLIAKVIAFASGKGFTLTGTTGAGGVAKKPTTGGTGGTGGTGATGATGAGATGG